MSRMSKTIAILGVVAGLGVAALPLSTYAETIVDGTAPDTAKDGVVSGNTTVKLTINDELSMELSKDTTEGNEVDLGDGTSTPEMTVKVITNNTTGYKLNLKGSTTVDSPVIATDLATANKDRIQAGTGTFTAPKALTAETFSAWGYKVANSNANNTVTYTQFTDGLYAGVDAGGQEIVNVSKPTGNAGDTTTVTFAADVKDGQAAGVYTGQVTFTATNNTVATN